MKRLILILVMLTGFSSAYAQISKEWRKGKYIKAQHMDRFVGTWQWSSNGDTLTISLNKKTFYYKQSDVRIDQLVGNYRFVKNGVEMQNSYKMSQDSDKLKVSALDRLPDSTDRSISIVMTFGDTHTQRFREMFLVADPINRRKAILKQSARQEKFELNKPENEFFATQGLLMTKIK